MSEKLKKRCIFRIKVRTIRYNLKKNVQSVQPFTTHTISAILGLVKKSVQSLHFGHHDGI